VGAKRIAATGLNPSLENAQHTDSRVTRRSVEAKELVPVIAK
jgi:hypothetical protein